MESPYVAFGREIGRAQDERLRESFDQERGRARLLSSLESKPCRWHAPVLAAAALALVMAGVLWLRADAPLEFRVAGEASGVEPGRILRAPARSPLQVTSSDGSRFELFAGGEASILRTDARGATVRVEQGTLRASVVHGSSTKWRVEAGPFVIDVIGTRFDAAWQRDSGRFSLILREGAVSVSGPVVGSKRTVRAGETLTVSHRDGELALVRSGAELERAPAPRPANAALESSASGGPAPTTESANASTHPPNSPPPSAAESLDFRALARSNEYEEALRMAERAGFEALCETANADDLLLLGDAARLAKSPERAEQAYRAVRKRFGGSNAARAGFLLGRLAFDGRGAYAEAARYFALSLLEEPNGPFSRDAAGRLVEALDKSGDVTGAKAAAERYLERYPQGPHSSLARTLLARP
jgi:TolA-binding protein